MINRFAEFAVASELGTVLRTLKPDFRWLRLSLERKEQHAQEKAKREEVGQGGHVTQYSKRSISWLVPTGTAPPPSQNSKTIIEAVAAAKRLQEAAAKVAVFLVTLTRNGPTDNSFHLFNFHDNILFPNLISQLVL